LQLLEDRCVPTAGTLDPTFGAGGIASTSFDQVNHASAVAVAPAGAPDAGDVFVAGDSSHIDNSNVTSSFELARYGPTGALVASFGSGGHVVGPAGAANALAIQRDGKIIVAGPNLDPDASNNSVIARYNVDGTPDSSFGQAGLVQVASPIGFGVRALALEPDGHIVAAGQTAGGIFALARYTADGNLDTAFGSDGMVLTSFPGWDSAFAQAVALTAPTAAHPNGEIILAGETEQNVPGGHLNMALAEYDDQGHLDPSFGAGGLVTTAIGSTDDEVAGVAVQSDGKIVAAGYSNQGATGYDIALVRYRPDGSLDTGFGTGGKVTTDLGSADDEATGVVIQPDGRIVAAGFSSPGGNPHDIALACYNPDGSLDRSFGSGGVVTSALGPSVDVFANGVALQPDGKIVVAGTEVLGSTGSDFAVARYLGDSLVPAGTLDATFGAGGTVLTAGPALGYQTAVQPDGKVLVVGGGNGFALARYNPDGSLDTGFGDGGRVTTDVHAGDSASCVAVRPDGKIMVAGSGNNVVDLARYNADGSLDTSFGRGGETVTPIGTQVGTLLSVRVAPAAFEPDGKLLLTGDALSPSGVYEFALARVNADGSLDTGFGQNGVAVTDFGQPQFGSHAATALVQPDGKIVAGGTISDGGANDFALARFNPDGSPDATFGPGGTVTTDFGGADDWLATLALQADGKVVAAGASFPTAGPEGVPGNLGDFALARYNPDGSLDAGFGTGGRVTNNFGGTDDGVVSLAIQPDGKIVAGGFSGVVTDATYNYGFAVARYDRHGNLDPSFGVAGQVATDLGVDFAPGFSQAQVNSLALQPDGKVVAAGWVLTPTGADFALARYLGDPHVTVAVDPTASPAAVSANLQNVVTFIQNSSTYTAPPPIELPVTPATVETAVTAVNSLSAPAVPITITLDLGTGTVGDTTVSPPRNVTLVINGVDGPVTFVGHSPAFTVTGGTVVVTNATFRTATDAPTILVTGGSLTLRDDVIQESTGYGDAAIAVSGGTVDLGTSADPGGNTINVNGGGTFVRNTTSTPVTAVGVTYTVNATPLTPSSLSGLVWEDFNDDGQVDFGERGIRGVAVTLTGTDDLGNAVSVSQLTDGDGAYTFLNLRPGNYTLSESQPAGYTQGIDRVGTAGGSLAATDRFSVPLGVEVNGLNYNYGEQPPAGGSVHHGQTAGIGFWNNRNGQALIRALNGGSSSTQLANWLAATLPHTFGVHAGSSNLTGKTNADVAALFQQDFVMRGVKLDAQLLATALSVYATNATLDPTRVAASYGFTVSGDGAGTATANVGSNGDAFGVANNTTLTLMDLLLAADAQAVDGLLYGGNTTRRNEANNVFSAINQAGGL
jgi:uncharacterized delta-60 repeat protein